MLLSHVQKPVNIADRLLGIGGRYTASPPVDKRADGVKRFRHTDGGRTERTYRTTAPNHGDAVAEAAPNGIDVRVHAVDCQPKRTAELARVAV